MQRLRKGVLGYTVFPPKIGKNHALGVVQADSFQLHAHAAADQAADLGQQVSEGQAFWGLVSGRP